MNFKVGDRVRCTDYHCYAGSLGKVETVVEVGDGYLLVNPRRRCWNPNTHFEQVTPIYHRPEPEPEYEELDGWVCTGHNHGKGSVFWTSQQPHPGEPIYVKRHAHAHAPEVYDDLLRCECGAEEPLPGVFSL